VLLWSFFFGLILASIIVIGRKISKWTIFTLLTFAVGVAVAFFISITTPAETPESTWFIFLCGMIAITAMILPGISGSFILLLLKKYEFITGALKDFDLKVIITFVLGCGVGLITFSNLLSWMFKNYYNATVALLTGFMLGSLNVVWPWKNVLESRINSKGIEVPFRYESVLPQNFEGENLVFFAIVSMAFGFILIILLESFNSKEIK
jgi:putative membrane protein